MIGRDVFTIGNVIVFTTCWVCIQKFPINIF